MKTAYIKTQLLNTMLTMHSPVKKHRRSHVKLLFLLDIPVSIQLGWLFKVSNNATISTFKNLPCKHTSKRCKVLFHWISDSEVWD